MSAAYLRCNLLLDKGQFREARQAALDGLAVDPTDAYLLSALARAYRGLLDPLQALSFSEQAVALEPHDAELVAELAYMQHACGSDDKAIETARSARSLDPDNAFVLRISVALLLSHDRSTRRRGAQDLLVEARAVADGGVSAHPNLPLMHVTSGRVSMAEKQFVAAEEAARHALNLDPSSASAMNLLADALAKQGRTHEAGDVYIQAAKSDPTSDDALAGLREISNGKVVFLVVVLVLIFMVLASIGGPSIVVMPLIMVVAIGSIVMLGDAMSKRSQKRSASRRLNPDAQSILDQDRRLR